MARARQAYTLMETVLVMALLVILGAVTVPSLSRLQSPFRVNAAVDSVRAAWAEARAHAVEQGRPYRFGVVPQSGHFRVAPDDPEFWSGSGGTAGGNGGNGGNGGSSSQAKAYVLARSLPAGVQFSADGQA